MNGSAAASSASASSTAPSGSYGAWRSEMNAIAQLTRRVAQDAPLESAIAAAVVGESAGRSGDRRLSWSFDAAPSLPPSATAASPAAAAAAAAPPTFLQWMWGSSPVTNAPPSSAASSASPSSQQTRRQAAEGVAAALLHLLASAELPPRSDSDAPAQPSSSSATASRTAFVAAVDAVAAALASGDPLARPAPISAGHANGNRSGGGGGGGAAPVRSLIAFSHALPPMREAAAGSTSATAPVTSSLPPPVSRDIVGDGHFNNAFASLKQQAAERRRPASAGSAPRPPPAVAAAPTHAAPSKEVGLGAARAALDAADALLLRLRAQYRVSTAPSGRLAEAQTLVLRAAVCREAQRYMKAILRAVHRRFPTSAAQRSSAGAGAPVRGWAALAEAGSSTPLLRAVQHSLASAATGARGDGAADRRTSELPPLPAFPALASPLSTDASASRTSTPDGRTTAASPVLLAALARWRRLVDAQLRSLLLAEVTNCVAASHIFLGAAVEERQLGGDGGVGGCGERCPASSPLMLVHHGITHALRACGLLLSDAALESDVVLPATLVAEMAAAVAGDGAVDGGRCSAHTTLPALPARGCPHATRVWMLLVQLAMFLEQSGLQPQQQSHCVAAADDSTSDVPPLCNSSGGIDMQQLWELSAVVLLSRPLDSVQALDDAFKGTAAAAATTATPSLSLRRLLRGRHGAPTFDPGAQPRGSPARVEPQCGALPLCLVSLRRAAAAAVQRRAHGEALFDVTAALHLLLAFLEHDDVVEEPARGRVDYRRVLHEPVQLTDAVRAQRSAAYAVDVAELSLMHVLLLLLTSPVASGEAMARLGRLRQSGAASRQEGVEADEERVCGGSEGREALAGASDVVRGIGAALLATLDTLSTVAKHLQVMERATALPQPGRSAEHVIVAAWRDAETRGRSRDVDGVETPPPPAPVAVASTATPTHPGRRSVCAVTTSERYRRLKQSYQPSTPAPHSAAARTSTDASAAVAEATSVSDHQLTATSATVATLAHIVWELWEIVAALTLPLRVASTCTTQPTAGASLATGESWFDDTTATPAAATEVEGVMRYSAARLAVTAVEPRVVACLRALGGHDRLVLQLLRRLQTELLFPPLCGALT
ncbi:hypothetical protein NESM_000296400 [Novymonas esmeraldas]|uniref:Uncharacterized protein n=1 Tax=Novymonas esmeraldas TaxID=1808958 RepID=A0AAW0F6U1_9TRYP